MLKVSILMPTYNDFYYIRSAIDSILNQTFSDFEFIIVDDGSTDGTASIIRSYDDPRILLITHEKNLGRPYARNTALDAAKGEYIFLDEFKRQRCLRQAFSQGGKDLVPMLEEQMEGRLDTWDIQLDYSRFKHGCLGLNPVHSYTTNIGMGSGTHTVIENHRWDNDISLALPEVRLPEHIFVDKAIRLKLKKVYRPTRYGFVPLIKPQEL